MTSTSTDYSNLESTSNTNDLIFRYKNAPDYTIDGWIEMMWNAYVSVGVAVDKAEFMEAVTFGEQELKRLGNKGLQHGLRDTINSKIKVQLQWLSEHGHFPPALVDSKGDVIGGYCCAAIRATADKVRTSLKSLKDSHSLILVADNPSAVKSALNELGLDSIFSAIITPGQHPHTASDPNSASVKSQADAAFAGLSTLLDFML